MPRTRPRSLNLRTPIGGIYGNTMNYYPSPRRSPSRPRSRFCRQCANGCYPVVPSPMIPTSVVPSPMIPGATFYTVPCMVPMMYAPTPAPIMAPMSVPPVMYEEPPRLPEPPMPVYETDETDNGEMDDVRTTTEETLSTLQRNTIRKSDLNLIRDFEETKWLSIDETVNDMQDCTLKRSQWFQRSLELPPGIITKLKCEKLPAEMSGSSSLRNLNLQRLRIFGRVRQWSPTMRAIAEEEFTEMMILPQGTDMSTISYKLQTKNIQQYSEQHFNSTMRHHSTAYDQDWEDQPFTENTVVVTGRVDRVIPREVVQPTRTWSKEYKQTVKGTVDLSPEGRVINPTFTAFSEMPEDLIKLAPTPDQDTSYEVLNDGCQIRIRLDDKVDLSSIELRVDPIEEAVKVVFARHSEENANEIAIDDDQPTTTTNYDMQVSQTFYLSQKKFNINGIYKRVEGGHLLLFVPFAKGFHPNNLSSGRSVNVM